EVDVVHSANVRHVKEVERFGDGLNVQALAELEALGQTQVERLEAVAELQVITYQRQRAPRERPGVVLVDEGVQLRAFVELAAAGVALNDRDARRAIRELRLNVERHIRGQRVDRRKLESGGQIEHAGEREAMALVIRRRAFFEDQPIGVERP